MKIKAKILSVSVFLAGAILSGYAAAQNNAPVVANVFMEPVLHNYEMALNDLIRARKLGEASKVLSRIVQQYPNYGMPHYNLARISAMTGDQNQAYRHLEKAVEFGNYQAGQFTRDPMFRTLWSSDRFNKFLIVTDEKASRQQSQNPAQAMAIRDQQALVTTVNSRWDPAFGVLRSGFAFKGQAASETVMAFDMPDVEAKLNSWYATGKAAGNYGDLYDNRDRKHSPIKKRQFPQASHILYNDTVKKLNLDYGLNSQFVYNAITVGNSSTAITRGPFPRSLGRLAQTQGALMTKQALQYGSNQMYVYPSVHDYKAKQGDKFVANSPYLYMSVGASGSDRPILRALFAALAALKPEVKTFLKQNGLVAPTLQVLVRQSYHGSKTDDEGYLSAKAHPIAFKGDQINVLKLVDLAQSLTIDTIPPLVRLKVLDENKLLPGVDDFIAGFSERLYDLPNSIARIVRSTAYEKRMVVEVDHRVVGSAKQPVKYHWRVFNGDEQKIKIKPLNDTASKVELIVPWHDAHPLAYDPAIKSHRVEIAAFAQVGDLISAPAFMNFLYPSKQVRTYSPDGRLLKLVHDPDELKKTYQDPKLFAIRQWTDAYTYDEKGRLTGWERTRKNKKQGVRRVFNEKGHLILTVNNGKKNTKVRKVAYIMKAKKNKAPQVVEKVVP